MISWVKYLFFEDNMYKLRGSGNSKTTSVDMTIFSVGNPIQGLSDVIFGGSANGYSGKDNKGGGGGCCCCCCGGGSGHLIDESEIVL